MKRFQSILCPIIRPVIIATAVLWGTMGMVGAGRAADEPAGQKPRTKTVDISHYIAGGDGSRNNPYVGDDGHGGIGEAIAANGEGFAYWIPAGHYRVNADIELPSNVTVYGNGFSTVLHAAATDMTFIRSRGTRNIVIRDLMLDGGGSLDESGIGQCGGIVFDGVQDFRIHGIKIVQLGNLEDAENTGNQAVGVVTRWADQPSANGIVSGIIAEQITGHRGCDGIYVASYPGWYRDDDGKAYRREVPEEFHTRDIVVRDCFVDTVGRHCYCVAGHPDRGPLAENISFINCIGKNSLLSGCDVESGRKVTFHNCTFIHCGYPDLMGERPCTGGRLATGIAVGHAERDIDISGCKFYDCYYGVTYGTTKRLIVADNIFTNTEKTAISCELAQGPRDAVIRGNVIDNCGEHGIYSYSSYRVVAADNRINNCAEDGIYFMGSMDTQIQDNSITNCGRYAVNLKQSGRASVQNNLLRDCAAGVNLYHALAKKNVGHGVIISGNRFVGNENCAIRRGKHTNHLDYFLVTDNTIIGGLLCNGDIPGAHSQVRGNVIIEGEQAKGGGGQ